MKADVFTRHSCARVFLVHTRLFSRTIRSTTNSGRASRGTSAANVTVSPADTRRQRRTVERARAKAAPQRRMSVSRPAGRRRPLGAPRAFSGDRRNAGHYLPRSQVRPVFALHYGVRWPSSVELLVYWSPLAHWLHRFRPTHTVATKFSLARSM